MIHRPLLILALLVAALVATPAWAGTARSSDGHLVRWDGGLDDMGERVVRQLRPIALQVEAALGFPLRGGPAEVVVVSGHGRMLEEVGAPVPAWAAGVCIGSRSRIVIRSDLVEGGLLRSVVTTLRHEWVHLSWARRAGEHRRRLPLWVEEGLAEEIGGGISVDGGARLDFAATFGGLIPFEEISARWPQEAGRAALAYRQGRSWVRFFRDESGWDHLQRILVALADGGGVQAGPGSAPPFAELVLQHSGLPLSHWTAIWRAHVKERAAPWFHLLFRDFMGTIFLLIAVVALLTYGFLRRRRRRQIAELPDDPMPA